MNDGGTGNDSSRSGTVSRLSRIRVSVVDVEAMIELAVDQCVSVTYSLGTSYAVNGSKECLNGCQIPLNDEQRQPLQTAIKTPPPSCSSPHAQSHAAFCFDKRTNEATGLLDLHKRQGMHESHTKLRHLRSCPIECFPSIRARLFAM